MKKILSILLILIVAQVIFGVSILFDNTKDETAGNADWIIDNNQPDPYPAQSGINSGTSESYWTGAFSAFGVELVKLGYTVQTLPSSGSITYGSSSNSQDLSNYDVFIIPEPQDSFSSSERTAILNFVNNGGGLFMIADHDKADRNNNGWDAQDVFDNSLDISSNFNLSFNADNISADPSSYVESPQTYITTGISQIGFWNGSSISATGSSVEHIWEESSHTHGMLGTAEYGSGRVAGVGDSSPFDDGSGQSGNTLYDGWTDYNDADLALNTVKWLLKLDSSISAPTATSATNITSSGFTANWDAVSGATKYYFDVATDSGFSSMVSGYNNLDVGNVTSKAVSGLSAGTTYYYRIRAYDGTNTSSNSNTISVTTSGSGGGGNTETFANFPETGSSYNDGSFTGQDGSTWSYTKCRGDIQITNETPCLGKDATAKVESGTISGGCETLSFDYEKAFGTSIDLEVYVNTTLVSTITGGDGTVQNTGSINVSISGDFTLTFQQSSSSSGQIAIDNVTWTSSSTTISAPTATSATSITTSGFTANWDAVSGATKYYLDVATDSGFSSMVSGYNNLDVGNVTSKAVTGLSASTDYYYRVRAYDGTNTSSNSNTISLTTSSTISAPNATAATNITSSGFTSNWDAVSGATKYYLDVSTDSGFSSMVSGYNNLDVGNVTSKAVSGLSASTDYYYRVRAYDGTNTSSNSNTISVTTSSSGGSGGGTETFANFSETGSSYNTGSFTGQDGSTWSYTKCRGDIQITNETPCLGKDATAKVESGTISGGCETLSFDYEKPFSTSIDLEVYVNTTLVSTITGGDGTVQNTGSINVSISGDFTLTFQQAGSSSGQIAIDNVTWTSSSTTISAPTATSATSITTSGFTANWDAVSGATKYYLDVATDSGFSSMVSGYNNLDVGNVTSKAVSGLSASTDYYYRVRAYDGTNTSSNSNTISLTTSSTISAPNATAASSITSSGFTANWDTVTGATKYYFDVATDSGFSSMVSGYNNLDVGKVTSKDVTGLSASTDYYYRVRAYDGTDTSSNSNTISLTTSSSGGAGSVTDIMISEVSDASSSRSEYIELYNPTDTSFDLTGAKLIRVKVSDNSSEYVYDIGTDGAGDTTISAKGTLIIARAATKSQFESDWGITLGSNVNYNEGDSNLYFGTSTTRRWRLRMDGAKTSDTDDGTIIDDTNGAAGGSGNRTYQPSKGNFVTESSNNSTPGTSDVEQPLPVTLSEFNSSYFEHKAMLAWTTQSEFNNNYWNIYKSVSSNFGQAFNINDQPIPGSGTTSETTHYVYQDNTAIEYSTYWYWLESIDYAGGSTLFGPYEMNIEENDNNNAPNIVKNYGLQKNYPNPFNPQTTISFVLPTTQQARIDIFNAKGQHICQVFNETATSDRIYFVKWNGRNSAGKILPSGIYFYRLTTKNYGKTGKMLLLK